MYCTKHIDNTIQLILGIVFNLYFSFFCILLFYVNFCTKNLLNLLLKIAINRLQLLIFQICCIFILFFLFSFPWITERATTFISRSIFCNLMFPRVLYYSSNVFVVVSVLETLMVPFVVLFMILF